MNPSNTFTPSALTPGLVQKASVHPKLLQVLLAVLVLGGVQPAEAQVASTDIEDVVIPSYCRVSRTSYGGGTPDRCYVVCRSSLDNRQLCLNQIDIGYCNGLKPGGGYWVDMKYCLVFPNYYVLCPGLKSFVCIENPQGSQ